MYKSPIEMFYGGLQMEQENNILKAVQDVGVHVDRAELIKALMYDRQQYQKGYADGYNEGVKQGLHEVVNIITKDMGVDV